MPEVPLVPPLVPEEPFIPLVPDEPDVPEVPVTPEVPEVPDKPLVPDMPEDPFVPELPEVPDVPEVPFPSGNSIEITRPSSLTANDLLAEPEGTLNKNKSCLKTD